MLEHCRRTRKWRFRLCCRRSFYWFSFSRISWPYWGDKEDVRRGKRKLRAKHTQLRIVKELGNLHSCQAYFRSISTTHIPQRVLAAVSYFSRNFCPAQLLRCSALSIELGSRKKWLAARTNHRLVCSRRCQCDDDEWWTDSSVCVSQLFVCLSSSAKLLPTHIPVHQSIKHCVNQSVSLYRARWLQILLMMLINLANVSLSDAVNGQANRLVF